MITIRNPNVPGAITQGSREHPLDINDHLFGPTVTEVHWNVGKYCVLEITAPDGVFFSFGDFFVQGGLNPPAFSASDIIHPIENIVLQDTFADNLYNKDDYFWYIGTVVFPDRVPPDPFAYETIKAGISAPDRFIEPVDLRTLTNKEFPFQIGGWPTDGKWDDPAFPWGTWSDGRPAYLPASSGADPNAPGYYINPNWGLGEAYQTTTKKRDAYKSAYLLNFTKKPTVDDGLQDASIPISITSPEHDDDLPSYNIVLSLRMFPTSTVFHISGSSITATKAAPSTDTQEPSLTQSLNIPYDKVGVFTNITKDGFVPPL